MVEGRGGGRKGMRGGEIDLLPPWGLSLVSVANCRQGLGTDQSTACLVIS